MVRLIKKLIRDEKGNAIIETAVAIPMLLGLFMGLVFFTNAMRYKLVINMAAKEGARTYQVTMGNRIKTINKTNEELTLGRVEGASVDIDVFGTVKVVKPYGFYIPLYDKHLLNIKGEHLFMDEIEERYYQQGW